VYQVGTNKGIISNLCSGSGCFEFSCSADHPDMDCTQFLQANTRIVPDINPKLVPSESFPLNFY